MRILDLGAHDGFVSAHIIDTLHIDGPLHIDGVELNSHGVEVFNRRLVERDVTGRCVQGRAEDAPTLFEPGTYDAVIAYELIEHVTDVNGFLDACEAMCAPHGRVYISTPDGTFGSGQNPHHLRVYRAIDLAELLRRRGDLQAMMVGPDTISVVSYTPWQAFEKSVLHGMGEVAIVTGPGFKEWSPLDIEQSGGLGGSETAAAKLAEELHLLGYAVTVYGQVDPGVVGQIAYRHFSTFDPLTPRKAIISSRMPQIADRPHAAESLVLWMHDTDYGPEMTQERVEKFDGVMVLSQWHHEHVANLYPFAETLLQVTSNGIMPEFFEGPAPKREPHRAIVSSSPDRGLDLVLQWWPKVREQISDAELVFCYADVYAAVAALRPEVAEHHERIMALADQPGVVNLGALSQPALAHVMRECKLWLAPSWNTPHDVPFFETFCIGAVEAAAAGCVTLTSGWGALQERTEAGVAVKVAGSTGGVPRRPDKDLWIQSIVECLQADSAGAPSPEALATTWSRVAVDFAATFEGYRDPLTPGGKMGVLAAYRELHGDVSDAA